MKKELNDNIRELEKYMLDKVHTGSHIEWWNDVREEAKKHFTQRAISQLDASGYIKVFYLKQA